MSVLKKLSADTRKWACLIAAIAAMSVLVCTEPSDNCGQGRKLNAFTEFCYNGEAYPKCGGKDFNPPTEFCYEGEVLAKCGAEYNPVREFCYNKVIFAKCAGQEFTPDREFCFHNSDVYDKCNGEEFDPANGCNNEITLPKCGGFYINPQNEFCVNGVTYPLCYGVIYDPPNNPCGNGSKLTINIEPKGWGTVNVPLQQYYAPGTAVNVTATPVADSGGIFGGWSGAVESVGNPVTVTMNGDKTLTANFWWPKLSVSASPDSLGSVSYEPKSESYPFGTQVTITATATPRNNYMFSRWGYSSSIYFNDNDRNSNPITITMNKDISMVADFVRGITLKLSVWPPNSGTMSKNPDQPLYDPNQYVTVKVTATPADKYKFWGWVNGEVAGLWSGGGDSKQTMEIFIGGNDVMRTAIFTQAEKIESQDMTDPKDGKTYKTVIIGGVDQKEYNHYTFSNRWMAENLNYQTPNGSWCYDNSESNCNKYGRLYDWNTALTACPIGWHLPSYQEWERLYSSGIRPENLKAKSPDWDGTDDFGFLALPSGYSWPGDKFNEIGKVGYWWTATGIDDNHAKRVDISFLGYDDYIVNGYSVRCIEDD